MTKLELPGADVHGHRRGKQASEAGSRDAVRVSGESRPGTEEGHAASEQGFLAEQEQPPAVSCALLSGHLFHALLSHQDLQAHHLAIVVSARKVRTMDAAPSKQQHSVRLSIRTSCWWDAWVYCHAFGGSNLGSMELLESDLVSVAATQ